MPSRKSCYLSSNSEYQEVRQIMSNEKTEERKPYVKPEVRRVNLKPEESLVAGCKTLAGSSPAASPCSVNSCATLGS